jgi:hypothetical protein
MVSVDANTLFALLVPAHEGPANSSLLTPLRTPSHSFLNSSWVIVKPASSFFSLGKRKKSAGARSGE